MSGRQFDLIGTVIHGVACEIGMDHLSNPGVPPIERSSALARKKCGRALGLCAGSIFFS